MKYSTKGDPARKTRSDVQDLAVDARGMVEDLIADIDEISDRMSDSAVSFLTDQERAMDRDDYCPTARQMAWISVLYNRCIDRGGLGEQVFRELERRGVCPPDYKL